MTVASAMLNGAILVVTLILLYPAVAWLERRSALAAEERERIGRRPLLPLARTLKLLSKRSAPPPGADRILHIFAPVLGVACAMTMVALLPVTSARPGAVAPGASLLAALALMLATTWTVALGGAAGNNRLALLGGLRLAALRGGALLAAALSMVAIARQMGSLSLDAIVHSQTQPAFVLMPGRAVMAWGVLVSPVGAGLTLVAFAVVSQRMSPTRPDIALDLVDGYASAASGPVLLAHRVFEILELLAHGALFATIVLGSFSLPFGLGADGMTQSLLEVGLFVLKTLAGCTLIIVARHVIPPLSIEQGTRLSWLVLVPLAAAAVLIPRDFLVRFAS